MFNGMLNVYKEAGWTSNDVVSKLRGILHMKKIGHTGTLDPDAEGVLPVCLGSGTKLVDFIADRDKEYIAVLKLGVSTDTQDLSKGSAVLSSMPEEEVLQRVDADALEAAVLSFQGDYAQIPPMYSALSVNGRKLYEYARAGQTVERRERHVTIHAIEILGTKLPRVTLRVRCSKGTYIRTLCDDIGRKLGTGGAMESLLRTRVGQFSLGDALKLEEIQKLADEGEIASRVIPVSDFFADCPAAHVKHEAARGLYNGNALRESEFREPVTAALEAISAAAAVAGMTAENGVSQVAGRVRVYDAEDRFCAIYRYDSKKALFRPEQMFLPEELVPNKKKIPEQKAEQ